ncbi:MurR/RpiR family transcriptional regulator [Pelagibius litoralis]|uniref:MurR/RpiR family transcriptional regulator n=1 Tax=Pelagibius litoralis TaxID=374515 RepID=A0A967KGK7_9PROT|nr:MurR/RpiR family transcriptional regulator [Pelagibius litoralis]NIA72255.1 MurR/RpiR family transcriptional regulator [Pelagibius litoralis]
MSGPVRERLLACLATASKADRTLANFMLSQQSSLPFETAASLAARVEVSEPTVGRFCRSIGYKSFKDLKDHLKQDIGDKPWLVSDRLRDLRDRAKAGEDQLAAGLELEISALVAIYELARTEEWARVVRRLATTTNIYAAGFQTERGMAQILVNQLQYLRDGVRLLDLAGGNFAELLASDSAQSCLVIFEARRYSRLARELAAEAKQAGIPVTLVTDPFCDWGRDLADEVFVVPTEFNQFWESTAQMASLANLLVNGVFLELGPKVEARMETVTRLYSRFTGYVGEPANRTTKSGSDAA